MTGHSMRPEFPVMRSAARVFSVGATVLFALTFPLLDGFTRRGPIDGRTLVAYVGSFVFWLLLAGAVCSDGGRPLLRHVGRGLASVVHGTLFSSQLFAIRYFGAPLSGQSLAAARAAWGDVTRVLSELRSTLIVAALLASGVSFLLLTLARRLVIVSFLRPPKRFALAALAILALVFGKPTPDAALVFGLPALRAAPKQAMSHIAQVATLPSNRELPDILLVITESVRAIDFCSAPAAACPTAPELNAFAPDRIGFTELRSLASYTTIAVGALLSGREQLGDHTRLEGMPLAFDYAKAVRHDGSRYYVAYYGAQISSSVFERGTIQNATDKMIDLPDLVGHPVEDEDQVLDTLPDRLLEARFSKDIASLPSPRFIVVHLLGTHAPYAVDPANAPFQPYRRSPSFAHMDELHNAYKNALVAQDLDLTKMLRAFADSEGKRPWMLLYTSDHGEAFGEHGAIHHGQNLYTEQVHVPGFLVSRNGALSDRALSDVRVHAHEPLTHADVVPTLLDAMGVWSSVEMLPYRREMVGQSWLAPFSRVRAPIAVTNCNGSFKCPLNNWGILGSDAAIVAQAWDPGWKCVRVGGEGTPDPDACAALRANSRARFPLLPNGEQNR